jgi:3-isopropylmalate/(R)-2-methylmalate dehydratase large subunit
MATLIEKIFTQHTGKVVRAGDMVDLVLDVMAARDFGGANVVRNLVDHHLPVQDVSRTFFTFDCNPTGSDQKYAINQQICRQFARKQNIHVYDIDQGIGTHLAIDKGLVGPGGTFVSTDSHANILGAIGAFGQGMGDVDIAYAFSHGKIWFRVPHTLKIRVTGLLPPDCTAKDLVLAFLRNFGADGMLGYAVELTGNAIETLNLSGRITLSSMATEMGGIIILIPPSDQVISYCRKAGANFKPLFADADATYQNTIRLNISDLEPLISRPGHPEDVVPVRDIEGVPVDSVFIGSCTNGRYEDMQMVAEVLKDRRIADHVVLKIVPATDAIWQQCMKNGIFDIFKRAGAIISNAGCAGCAAGQVGQNGPGEVTVSTGNRNFAGKQGEGSVYLASPATAAATALAGFIVSAKRLNQNIKIKSPRVISDSEKVNAQPDRHKDEWNKRPIILNGRVWVIRKDHIDTDMIYHNRYLSVTDPNEMGQYTFRNLEDWQDFPNKVQFGDIIVTGQNFGCGSSRLQAVECFKNLGIKMIIARSFGAIYERNAINSAFPILKANLLDIHIQHGNCVEVNLETGVIQTENGTTVQGSSFSDIQMSIYQRGGLL